MDFDVVQSRLEPRPFVFQASRCRQCASTHQRHKRDRMASMPGAFRQVYLDVEGEQ